MVHIIWDIFNLYLFLVFLVKSLISDKYFLFAAAIDAQRTATIRPKASKRRGGLFKNGGKAKYRGQTARRRAEKLAAAESSTLKPLDSISVNQDKIEAIKKIVEITEQQEKQDVVEITEDIENIQEDSPEEVVKTKIKPEIQLKQAIEETSDEDYVYEEETKDYSSEYMVNDAIEYPTLIDEEPEEIDESSEAETTEDTEDEVAGALNMS